PLWIRSYVRAIVVEQIALNLRLPRLTQERELVSPQIGVVKFHVGIIANMARPGGCKRQQICAKRTFVGSAICPEGPAWLPIRSQTFVVRNSVLDNESL